MIDMYGWAMIACGVINGVGSEIANLEDFGESGLLYGSERLAMWWR